jgi:hypothetical protein
MSLHDPVGRKLIPAQDLFCCMGKRQTIIFRELSLHSAGEFSRAVQRHVLRCTPRGRGRAGGRRPPAPAGLKTDQNTGNFAWILPFSTLTNPIKPGGTVAG